jgi:hypothetical protein
MARVRRTFTREFKRDAVRLVVTEGNGKRALLRAIERASRVVPRRRPVVYARGAMISVRCNCSGHGAECPEMQLACEQT